MRQNKNQFRQRLRRLFAAGLVLCLLSINATPVLAASKPSSGKSGSSTSNAVSAQPATQNISAAVSQTYNADKTVQLGMIVELKTKDPTTVVPLKAADIKNMLGIVVPQSNATIVLTPQNIQQQQVLVATTGHYNLLVSNQNGPIKTGDYLTISAIDGVAMKADDNQTEVVGEAAGPFNGTSNVIGQVQLKDSLGHTTKAALGSIPIDVAISHNPLYQKTADYVPGFLAKVAVSVANHSVSAARIYMAMAVLFVISIITGNMLYSGVRSGMIAVGRNPLSKKSIIRSLIQTVIAGLIIFLAGVFAVYLLLKL